MQRTHLGTFIPVPTEPIPAWPVLLGGSCPVPPLTSSTFFFRTREACEVIGSYTTASRFSTNTSLLRHRLRSSGERKTTSPMLLAVMGLDWQPEGKELVRQRACAPCVPRVCPSHLALLLPQGSGPC